MNPLALTAEEAAHQLGISRSKFFGLMASGDIASIKVGRSRLVSADSVKRMPSALGAVFGCDGHDRVRLEVAGSRVELDDLAHQRVARLWSPGLRGRSVETV